jgi:predicted TPR repeat methyltransferase
VYHFKDHSQEDQFWRDIPLEVSKTSTADSVVGELFKEHAYYFDHELVNREQVQRLVQMIIDKNSEAERKSNL